MSDMELGYAEVTECRACRRPLPSNNVLSLGVAPVVDFPERAGEPVLRAPLEVVECLQCGLAQLRHTVNQDRLYRTFWYRSGTTHSMREALRDVVKGATERVKLVPGDAVLDIGANDGTLLGLYPENAFRVGYEPAANLETVAIQHCNKLVIGYFPDKSWPLDWVHRFKVITAVAMFYDVADPGEFLEAVKLALHPEGIFVVQMNYLQTMLKDLAVDNVCHEHLGYYSAGAFVRLVEAHGLKVTGIETNEVNGGSIRLYVRLAGGGSVQGNTVTFHRFEVSEQARRFIELEQPPNWQWFAERLARVRHVVTRYLEMCRDKQRRLAVLGASTRGLTLMHFLGLGRETFGVVGDRDPGKHGRYYGATGIPIVGEMDARKRADVMLVLPWHFEREIRERERAWIERGGELLFPLPKPHVVSSKGVEWL